MNVGDQPLRSIGSLLAAEREKKGIPLEKAAKETRMRIQRIRDMESDDLSHFTNPSYARMFIIAYAKYLGIPQQQVQDLLPDRGELCSEGYQYISSDSAHLPELRPDLASRPLRQSRILPLVAGLALLGLLVGGGFLAYYLTVNLPRLTAANTDKPKPVEIIRVKEPPPVFKSENVTVTETLNGRKVVETATAAAAFGAPIEITAGAAPAGGDLVPDSGVSPESNAPKPAEAAQTPPDQVEADRALLETVEQGAAQPQP